MDKFINNPFAERLDNFIIKNSSNMQELKRGGTIKQNQIVNPGTFVGGMYYDEGGSTLDPAISDQIATDPTIDDYVNKVLGQFKNQDAQDNSMQYMAEGGDSEVNQPFMDKTSRFANKIKEISFKKLVKDSRYDLKKQLPGIMDEFRKDLGGPLKKQSDGGPDCTDEDKQDPASPCYDPYFTPSYVQNIGDNQVSADTIYSPLGSQPKVNSPEPKGLAQSLKDNPTPSTQGTQTFQGMSGPNQANALIAGMNFFTGMLNSKNGPEAQKKLVANTHADKVFAKMKQKDKGRWTVNEGYIDPQDTIPVQFKGLNYSNPYAAEGGSQVPYEENEEYDLTDEEIQKILSAGGSVEYLD